MLPLCLAIGTASACSNGEGGDPAQGGEELDGPGSGGGSVTGDGDGDSGANGDGDGDGDLAGGGAPPIDSPGVDCQDLALCGEDGTSDCCARAEVPGGKFLMGVGDDSDACPSDATCGAHEKPEHEVTVSGFYLDVFEVTVGRFRAYVEGYDAFEIQPGQGAHPLIEGSGYQEEFEASRPVDEEALRASLLCDDDATWTDQAGDNEALPINCVSWAVAFSFCAFDGGRLPTEAEWEFAAAGGDENRLYPWGAGEPNTNRAAYFPSMLARAGSFPDGEGRYGTFDLAGSVWEWALDWLDTGWYSDGGAECVDCGRVSSGTHRVLRGGAYSYQEAALRSAARSGELPGAVEAAIGFRCAYDSSTSQK